MSFMTQHSVPDCGGNNDARGAISCSEQNKFIKSREQSVPHHPSPLIASVYSIRGNHPLMTMSVIVGTRRRRER